MFVVYIDRVGKIETIRIDIFDLFVVTIINKCVLL